MVSAPAAQAQFKAGEYVRSGYGVLTVGAADRGATKFQISVVGSNFHTCELEGVIRNLEARMEESADDKLPCVVTFKPEKNGITVDAKNDRACSAYCGMRASFTGSYAIPRAGCAPSQVRQTRARFNAAYAKKQFADARVLLTPVHANCAPYLDIYGQAWVGNDLALTQYRTGDSAACRNTLKPWLDLAQTPDNVIKGDYPPSDAEEMLRIAIVTRTNMKLCGAPVVIGAKPAA